MALYDTTVMLKTVSKMYPVACFFRNRYFPTAPDDIFPTNEVLIEYREGTRKMAPFVIPRKGGIAVTREGYSAKRYAPPLIAPEMPLTIDDLNKKGFGEGIYSNKSPEQRQAEILGSDLADLGERIDRREEWMCREILVSGQVIMKHYAETYGKGIPEEKILRFYSSTFDNKFTPEVDWDEEGATPFRDTSCMVQMLIKAGLPIKDLIFSYDAWERFILDDETQKVLNNRRIEAGMIEPVETPDGVSHMGQIVLHGKKVDIFVYEEQFENDEGELESFLPAGTVIATAPGMGRMLYGSITQLENDEQFYTYTGTKIPYYVSDKHNGVRTLRVSSAPVPVPTDRRAWAVASVFSD